MKKFITIAALFCGLLATANAQVGQASPSPSGKYGLQSWAINNQRVASQYNYQVPSSWTSGLGAYNFPPRVCSSLYNFSGRTAAPWNTNATVTVTDNGNSSNTETVALNSASIVNGYCSISLAVTHTHASYTLSSGTCGLREALNDMQGKGGEVIVDQGFYDAGCSAATITAQTLAAFVPGSSNGTNVVGTGVLASQYVHDVSNGQDTWYLLKPLGNTQVSAAGAALTLTATAGSGSYYVNYEYVGPLGGQGLSNTESTQATSATLPITTSAPAAATGAVGWIPMITASGGASASEIAVPVTSSVCTLAVQTPYPACAIGAAATISTQPLHTSIENVESFSQTTFGYLPIAGTPSLSSSSGWGDFQTAFLPFVVGSTLSSSNEDLAQFVVPGGYFNKLGGSWDICVKMGVGTEVASSVLNMELTMANNYGYQPVIIQKLIFPTQTLAAAGNVAGCFEITTAVTGSAGQFWAQTPGPWSNTLNSTGAGSIAGDSSAAISTSTNAPDLTKPIYIAVHAIETAGDNITTPIVNALIIKPANNN